MKTKTVFAASLLLAGAAFATATTVDSSYVLGVMPVNASGKRQVILSIPWVAEGGATAIAVTNLVKTAGLTVGDTLTWYDTTAGKYKQWQVAENGGVGYWTPVTVTEDTGSYATPAENATLLQGQAVVLTRTATGEEDLNKPSYVIGQVGTNATASTTISGNSWHMLAPPVASTSDVDFNTCASDGSTWSSCVGDEVTIDGANGLYKTYKCVDLGEGKALRYVWTTSMFATTHAAMIPAGRGFWYKRNSDSSVTITWSGVPTTTASN